MIEARCRPDAHSTSQHQSKKSFVGSSRNSMSSTSSIAKSTSSPRYRELYESPMKRARKSLSLRRLISLWLQRFDHFRKESAANGTLVIQEKLLAAAHELQTRWAMATASSVEMSFHTGANARTTNIALTTSLNITVVFAADVPALFVRRHRTLHKVTDRVVELMLAPVFFCCIALDRMSRPTRLPCTSIFSASIITCVLNVLSIATELQQKHLPIQKFTSK